MYTWSLTYLYLVHNPSVNTSRLAMVAIHTLGAGWRFCSGILYVLTWKFNGMMIHDVWLSQSDVFLHLYMYEPPTSHAAMSCSGIESGADQLSTHLQVRQILRSSLRVWGTSGYLRVPLGYPWGTPGTGWWGPVQSIDLLTLNLDFPID